VATGRLIKGAEMFMLFPRRGLETEAEISRRRFLPTEKTLVAHSSPVLA
jgi:hypothetical protein